MHKFVLQCFGFFRSFMQFMKIVITFIILLLLFYWVQNLTGANWAWLSFIKPCFDGLLDLSNRIYSFSFDFFGAVFELKYLTAVVILILLGVVMNILSAWSRIVEDIYRKAHTVYKKTSEAIFNHQLEASVANKEKKMQKYSIILKARINRRIAIKGLEIDVDNQNKQINDFIASTLEINPFLVVVTKKNEYIFSEYKFDDFGKIDEVLDVLFKIFTSKVQLDYAMCVQIGDNQVQLEKLLSLNNFGKITMAADTAFRYKYNESQKHKVSVLGEFKYNETTLEVHEFIKGTSEEV